MLGQDLFDDVRHRQVLEHPRTDAMPQQRERRFDGQLVAAEAAIRAQALHLGHHAATQAFRAGGIEDTEAGRQAEQGLEFDRAVRRQTGELVGVGPGHAFLASQAQRQQLLGRHAAVAQAEGEQALVLIEGGGEAGEQGAEAHGALSG